MVIKGLRGIKKVVKWIDCSGRCDRGGHLGGAEKEKEVSGVF